MSERPIELITVPMTTWMVLAELAFLVLVMAGLVFYLLSLLDAYDDRRYVLREYAKASRDIDPEYIRMIGTLLRNEVLRVVSQVVVVSIALLMMLTDAPRSFGVIMVLVVMACLVMVVFLVGAITDRLDRNRLLERMDRQKPPEA